MTGSLLVGDRLARFGALGASGDTVWRQAAQVRAAVAQRYGAEYAAIFAEPRVDELGGRIDWYAPAEGQPTAWRDLDPQTARRAGERLDAIRQTLETRAAELQTSNRSDAERAFGRLLKQALIWPGEQAQWLVGDTPVIAWWGFADPSMAAAPRRMAAAPPPPAPTPPPAAVAAGATAAPAQGATLASAPAMVVARGTPWWAVALIALGTLALLFGLVWFLRPYMPTIPGLAAYGEAAAKAGNTPAPGYDATLKELQEREKQLQAELASLQKPATPENCPPGQSGETTPPGGVGPGGVAIGPGGVAGPDASKGPDSSKGGSTPGATTPPPPRPDMPKGPDAAKGPDAPKGPDASKGPTPPKGPNAAKGPQQQTPPPPNPQQAQRPPDKPLVVPPDARRSRDVGFMEGEWKSHSDLQTPDGKEVTVNYELDKTGKGKRIVQQGNMRCEAPAQARFDANGKLIIEDQADAKCADGSSFAKGVVTCDVAPDGKATCAGQQAGGARYNVQIGR